MPFAAVSQHSRMKPCVYGLQMIYSSTSSKSPYSRSAKRRARSCAPGPAKIATSQPPSSSMLWTRHSSSPVRSRNSLACAVLWRKEYSPAIAPPRERDEAGGREGNIDEIFIRPENERADHAREKRASDKDSYRGGSEAGAVSPSHPLILCEAAIPRAWRSNGGAAAPPCAARRRSARSSCQKAGAVACPGFSVSSVAPA